MFMQLAQALINQANEQKRRASIFVQASQDLKRYGLEGASCDHVFYAEGCFDFDGVSCKMVMKRWG